MRGVIDKVRMSMKRCVVKENRYSGIVIDWLK